MAEMKTDIDLGGEKDDTFMTDPVHANRDIHSGLGVGARELAAQRDAHGAQATPALPIADTEEDLGDDEADDDDQGSAGGARAGAEKSRQEDA